MRCLPCAAALVCAAACATPPKGATVRVTIPRGAAVPAVAETLATHGVVASAGLFRFYARLTQRGRAIRAGVYDLSSGSSVRESLRALIRGRPAEQRLVIPEGLMLAEVADVVQQQLGISAEGFRRAATDSAMLRPSGIPAGSAEGYLYPSTYFVPFGASAADIVHQMVDEFARRWRPEWTARLDSVGLTRHQIVTLASIIEGEVHYAPDAPYVSSVYHNRLARGMRLQADPTVIYSLGRRRRLYEKDYLRPSPYNTYQIDGLPPGPINQPSAASIEAALYPAQTNFLYLVARPDGKHIFSRTLREHMEAVREVRRMAATNGR